MEGKQAGAVIIGGDYQGLGIVRSLGKRGVPTCIIDDELSISRFSRYATYAAHVKNLRDERQTIEAVLDIGQRLHLNGWVLFQPAMKRLSPSLATVLNSQNISACPPLS